MFIWYLFQEIKINVFYLSHDPVECAKQHCDKHVVKMIVESAQLLSTAHRVLDGTFELHPETGKKHWKHPVESYEERLYKASHMKHPDELWIQKSGDQYMYLYKLFEALAKEYEHRYGKKHITYETLYMFLNVPPRAIWNVKGFVEPPQCMPEQYKEDNAIDGYRNYYIGEKLDFIRYTNRPCPGWLKSMLEYYHKSSGIKYEITRERRCL